MLVIYTSNVLRCLREHLVLRNKTACRTISFCFPIVITLREVVVVCVCFGPSLCVLAKIDKHPCVTHDVKFLLE